MFKVAARLLKKGFFWFAFADRICLLIAIGTVLLAVSASAGEKPPPKNSPRPHGSPKVTQRSSSVLAEKSTKAHNSAVQLRILRQKSFIPPASHK